MRDEFLTTLLSSLNVDPAAVRDQRVTVAGHERRAETHVTAGYIIDDHLVVSCDPAAEQMLAEATAGMAPTLETWQQIAVAAGGELLGSGRMQLLGGALPSLPPLLDGFTRRSLDRDDSSDLALIERLIEVIVDSEGAIAVYAAARPFDLAPGFGDIGIMTRPDVRSRGLGSLLVAALCPRLRAAGLEPLYPCDEDNVGSVKLSAGLGFEIATQLAGYRFP